MQSYKEIVDITYFTKEREIDIDDAINSIVYLEVDSPLNYGLRTWSYYGRVASVTKCYFEIIEYCDGFLNNWRTDQIEMKERSQRKKKWAKKSIQKLLLVRTEERTEEVTYYKN